MLKHDIGLRKIVKKRISQGKGYMEILKSIYGADPREVWEIFKDYKKETSKKIGITNLYPNLPEPHSAYSQWRITPDSTKIILSKIIGKNYKKVVFLGCPVLGIEFSKLCPGKSILLDIDKKILDYARNFTETRTYDINDKPPIETRDKFECVVCDPPWYYEEIKLFIKRAAELAKIGGTIYFSLPSLLTKPSIVKERLELQKWLSSAKLIIAELNQIVEYEVPPFEYMAYQDIPAFTGEVWRRGDWLKLKKAQTCKINAEIITHDNWLEYSVGKKRIFLKEKEDSGVYEKPKLSYLYPGKSLVLNSVSKRHPLIPKIDIWTSRNVILHLESGFGVIKVILENITKDDKKIIKIISERYKVDIVKVNSDCIEPIKILKGMVNI